MATRQSRLIGFTAFAVGTLFFAATFHFVLFQKYVQAQDQPATQTEKKDETPGKTGKEAVQRQRVPGTKQLQLLIQSYMIALSQANLTGNYTVLRALGSPSFRRNNPPQRLRQIFSNLRQRNIDLTPIVLYPPILKRSPIINDKGMLLITGYYATEPKQVHFELTLQPVAKTWRLFSISVKTVPSAKAAASTAKKSQEPADRRNGAAKK